MNNAVTALIWETWRLSRRWYLWVLPVALALDFLIELFEPLFHNR